MAVKKQALANLAELRKAVRSVAAERKDVAESLITEISFLESTLEELRSQVAKDGPIVATKGGSRENPALKAYNTTIQRYSLLFKQVTDILPASKEGPTSDPLMDFIKQG